MVKDFFTVQDVAQVLDIYEVSARELVDGVIDFEPDELGLGRVRRGDGGAVG